jgi:hypothetical protein
LNRRTEKGLRNAREPPVWSLNVRQRVKRLALLAQGLGFSPLLPAAAVMVITIFTVSLAIASPAMALPVPDQASAMAERGNLAGAITPVATRTRATGDSATDTEAAIFSAPLPAPHYHDRYRFYHRYDFYSPPPRPSPLDDGLN